MNKTSPKGRPRLVDLAVPWCIDALQASFRLVKGEHEDDQPTQAAFCAFALPDDRQGPFVMQLIAVTFQEAVAARMIPFEPSEFLEFESEESKGSDVEGFERGVRKFQEQLGRWRKTGICPSSGFFEVVQSPWVRELGIDDEEFRHYFSFGRSVRLDVIARGWTWRVDRIIQNAPPPLWPPG